MTSKFIQLFFLFFVNYINAFSQITSTEGFESNNYPPAGWSIKVNIPVPGTNVWIRQPAPTTNPVTSAHGGSVVSRFRSRNVAAGTKQYLISRPIDYTSRDTHSAKLEFYMYRDSLFKANVDSLTVWVSLLDSINVDAVKLGTIARNRGIAIPDTQSVNAWYHFSYDVPDTFKGAPIYFIFEGTSQTLVAGQGSNMYIDDVSFDEFPPLCTGLPDVGVIINNNSLICNGGGKATLHLSNPIDSFSGIIYTWEETNDTSGTWTSVGTNSSLLNIPSITATTYYRCTVLCTNSSLTYTTPIDSIIVLANLSPIVSVTPRTAFFCAGGNGVQLIASGALYYTWSPTTGLSDFNKDTINAAPAMSSQYIVTGIDSFGCKDTAVANVAVNPLPTTNITANPNDTVCFGTRVILTAIPFGGGGNTYLWSNGATSRTDTLIANQDSTLSVNVTSAVGCSKADTISLVVLPITVANFGYSNTVNTFDFQDSSVAVATWTWDFGDGDTSNLQNPTHTYDTPGIYKVTLVIKGLYCNNDTISKLVMSGPICTGNPDVGHILNTNPIVCEGSNITLNLSAPIIGLSGITYSWERADTDSGPWIPIGTNSISLDVSSLSATTYFRCNTSCAFSSLSYTTPIDSIVVLPNPLISTIPSSGSFCKGSTGLTVIASGANSYSWTPSIGLSATVGDTVVATPDSSMVYIITGTGLNGCVDTAHVNIIVNPLPATNITAFPNDTICNGTQIILSALPVGGNGNSYLWSNGIRSRRDTITPISADTTFSVVVTNSAGCTKADTISISTLIADFTYTNVLNTFTFTDVTVHGITWSWEFGDGNVSALQNPVHTFLVPGTYTVKLIVANGICNDTISKMIRVSLDGANDITGNLKLKYYPNPVHQQIFIEVENQLIDNVTINNQVGQKVLSYSNVTKKNMISFSTESLSNGMYFTELLVNGNRYTFKFIKE